MPENKIYMSKYALITEKSLDDPHRSFAAMNIYY